MSSGPLFRTLFTWFEVSDGILPASWENLLQIPSAIML
jgi:hypothetical protein